MTEEEIKLFSSRYKKHQVRLSRGLAVAIIIVACILMGFGITLAFIADEYVVRIFAVIMTAMGIFDIPLAIFLIKRSKSTFESISDEEAAKRYVRIYGYEKK